MESRGFDIIGRYNPTASTMRESLSMLRQARFVVGVHGAGMANAIAFMHPHSTVVEIFPANWIEGCFRSLAGWRNLRYLKYQATEPECAFCGEPSHADIACGEYYKNTDLQLDLERFNSTLTVLTDSLDGQYFNFEIVLKSPRECTNSSVKFCVFGDNEPRSQCLIRTSQLNLLLPLRPDSECEYEVPN